MFWRRSVADQVDEELEFHLEMVTRDLIARGRSEPEARAEALRRFGDLAAVGARCRKLGLEHERSERRAEYLNELQQDVRLAFRHLRRAPAFAIVAILTLVLAIGANTAIFSAVSAVLLRPLPYPHADRLVAIWGKLGESPRVLLSYPDLVEYRTRSRTLDDLSIIRGQSVNITGSDRPDRLSGAFVSANVFRLLGARAQLGRVFTDEEASVGTAARVAVLSHAIWTSRFGADSGLVGRTLVLNGVPQQVIGVLGAEYQDPFGPTEVWLPFTTAPNPAWLTREGAAFWAVGRMRPGVTAANASADLSRIAGELAAEFPETNAGLGIGLQPLRDSLVGEVRPALLILLGFVALILLHRLRQHRQPPARPGHRAPAGDVAPRGTRRRARPAGPPAPDGERGAGADRRDGGRAGGALGDRRAGDDGAGRTAVVRRGGARPHGAALLARDHDRRRARLRRGAGAVRHPGPAGRRAAGPRGRPPRRDRGAPALRGGAVRPLHRAADRRGAAGAELQPAAAGADRSQPRPPGHRRAPAAGDEVRQRHAGRGVRPAGAGAAPGDPGRAVGGAGRGDPAERQLGDDELPGGGAGDARQPGSHRAEQRGERRVLRHDGDPGGAGAGVQPDGPAGRAGGGDREPGAGAADVAGGVAARGSGSRCRGRRWWWRRSSAWWGT